MTASATAAFSAALMVAGASCTTDPVPPAAPTLPTGIGFDWMQDTGGTIGPIGPFDYDPAFSRYRLLDGVVNGPTPVEASEITLNPTLGPLIRWSGPYLFPDGTAKFPWNGFAGEGITTEVSAVSENGGTVTTYDVTGAAGKCTFTSQSFFENTPTTAAAIPSPDGTKVAVLRLEPNWNYPGGQTTELAVHDLDSTCAVLAEVTYQSFGGTDEEIASPMTVWAPDSSEILYPVKHRSGGSRLERLAANGSTPPSVIVDDPEASLLPLGWSETGRILLKRRLQDPATQTDSSTIETMAASGGQRRVIDTQTNDVSRTEYAIFGYFVPGTSLVLYTGGPRTTTLDGVVRAWPKIRLHDDATGGDGAVPETDAPLMTHPTDDGEVPNEMFIDRFIR